MGQSLTWEIIQSQYKNYASVRLKIWYHSTLAVVDSNNTFTVSGHWSYSAAAPINLPGSSGGSQLIFDTAISVTKVYNSTQLRSFAASISGINFWGGTASTSGSATIPAKDPDPPNTPSTPTVSNVTATSARVNMSMPASNGATITSTRFLLYNAASGGSLVFSNTVSPAVSSYTFTGLSPTATYYAAVYATNSAGNSGISGRRGFTTPSGVPNTPGSPTFSAITSSQIRSTVAAPSNNGSAILEYAHQRALNSGMSSGVWSTNDPSRAYTFTGLSRASLYYFRARARNANGWGPWSSVRSARTDPELPVMGDTSSATGLTRNSAIIQGTSLTDNGGEAPDDLRVQYNTSASASGASVVTRGAWAQVTLSGLTAETTYYYRVAAHNSAGWSDYNAWQSFTTLSDAPDDIAELTFSAVDDTEFTVSWDAPNMNGAVFDAYRYEIALTDTFTDATVGSTTNTSVSFTGLIPGTRYFVRVRANATPNNGGWGTGDQRTTGVAPNAGLRIYTFEGELRKKWLPYTFIGGELKPLAVMYAHDGVVETE